MGLGHQLGIPPLNGTGGLFKRSKAWNGRIFSIEAFGWSPHVARRHRRYPHEFMQDMAGLLANRVQLTNDGHKA